MSPSPAKKNSAKMVPQGVLSFYTEKKQDCAVLQILR